MAYVKKTWVDDVDAANATNFNRMEVGIDEAHSVMSGKNLLLNPLGIINQRGYVSATVTTSANEYTLDRFRVITLGEALTFSVTENVTTFTAPTNGIAQTIAGENIISGTYVISGLLTATCTVDGVAKVNGDTFTLTGGTDCVVIFINGTFSLPKVEHGLIVTKFEQKNTGLELSECKYYFERITYKSTVAMGFVASTTSMRIPFSYNTKRVEPTISFSSQTGFSIQDGNSTNTTAMTGSEIGVDNARLIATVAAGLTANNSAKIKSIIAGEYIDIDAEI